jgi:hypothetical protein
MKYQLFDTFEQLESPDLTRLCLSRILLTLRAEIIEELITQSDRTTWLQIVSTIQGLKFYALDFYNTVEQ